MSNHPNSDVEPLHALLVPNYDLFVQNQFDAREFVLAASYTTCVVCRFDRNA